ncbi:DNA replication/checkpoint protein [Coniochaeta hoffmannii]|uniref:DNA replication regulator SLD2 n=1 Tax=Coniochaeta hoffmannii TaxID=91930 RepID=A0AA38W0Q3_9PEZI|nr:DNA replication/checkpoint protein [Coniochaeta hoffmannii]
MDDTTRSEYETQSQTLRAELKQWETSWAKNHDGKKPSRDDIKQNPDIATKYKSYNKLRDILSGKLSPLSKSSPPRKRKSLPSTSAAATPSKRQRTTPSFSRTILLPDATTTTPSLNRKLFLSPASHKAPTPTSIGPTPQRDGKVLGLFDLLSGSEETPSRPRSGDFISDGVPDLLAATPRKRGHQDDEQESNGDSIATPAAHRHGRTPMSSSKRAMLDNFLLFTPLKNHDGNAGGTSFASRIGIASTNTATDKENGLLTTPKGPGSVSKSLFATPAFLKRGHKPLDTVDEEGRAEEEVRPLRLPRKPLVRGLSSVVAGLRKLEEEKLDDEMEAMREMEAEMDGGGSMPPPAKRQKVVDQPSQAGKGAGGGGEVDVVEDGQIEAKPVLLGGFDDENLLDSDVEEQQLDRGQPLRVYKKKGQKRTTRRVNMRPTRARRPAAQQEGGENEDGDDQEEVVPETQLVDTAVEREEDYKVMSGSDFEEDKTTKKSKSKTVKGKKDGNDGEEKEGTVKKAVRKVKATANANFKRLKLRNYGAKGGPGQNSRFRRRR